jgi:membrane protein
VEAQDSGEDLNISNMAGAIRDEAARVARMNPKEILGLFGVAFTEWNKDNAPRLGASLAYYTTLSIAPLLIVVIAVLALVFGDEAASGQIYWQLRQFLGEEGAKGIEAMIQGARKPAAGTVATVLGLITLAIGASSVVAELKDALNTIWKVVPAQGASTLKTILGMVRLRFFSFAVVLGVAFLLLVSLVLSAWIQAAANFFGRWWPVSPDVIQFVNMTASFVFITFLFMAIYKILPDVDIYWRDVVIGAAVTSFLFGVGKFIIGWYLGQASYGSTYGAVGSIVAMLVWVYYSAQIFFYGAEFTKVWAAAHGSKRSKKARKKLISPENLPATQPSARS